MGSVRSWMAARFFGLLVLAMLALVAWSGYAHAEGLDGGSPEMVDGGSAPPMPIHKGEPAPADGVFLTVQRAGEIAAERAALRASLAEAIKEQQPVGTVPAWVWVVTCAVGAAVGAYAAKKVK